MLGSVKEYIIESSEAGVDVYPEFGEDKVISALELKADTACTVTVNGNEFEVDEGEVLSFPYNYMRINSLSVEESGVKVKIRYLE